MYSTLTFNEMNTIQKLDWLSNMLGEACSAVNYMKRYFDMSDSEKDQIKVKFFDYLNREHAKIPHTVVELAEKEFQTSPLPQLLRQYGYYRESENTPITNAAEELNKCIGEKVTIVKFSDFGFPVTFQTVLNSVTVESYAQYNESLKIVHKPKRKRNLFQNRILPKENLTIYKGWIEFDTENATYNTLQDNDNVTVKQSKYGCFDDNFINDIVKSNKQEPIVNIG